MFAHESHSTPPVVIFDNLSFIQIKSIPASSYHTMHDFGKTLTHYGLRVPPEIVVWIYDTFDDNFMSRMILQNI